MNWGSLAHLAKIRLISLTSNSSRFMGRTFSDSVALRTSAQMKELLNPISTSTRTREVMTRAARVSKGSRDKRALEGARGHSRVRFEDRNPTISLSFIRMSPQLRSANRLRLGRWKVTKEPG